jgi:hypothetical protein
MLRVGRGIRDIWIYFKAGHSGYLTFTLSIMNFIVLQHRLFISYVPFLSQYLEKLSTFVIVFFLTYIPLAVLVGYFDFRKGGMMRRPKLNPYIQDTIAAQILQTKGLLDYVNGDTDEAIKQLEESLKHLRKWRNTQRPP